MKLLILSLRKVSCPSEILSSNVLPSWVLPCLPLLRCLLKSRLHSRYTCHTSRPQDACIWVPSSLKALPTADRGIPLSPGWRESLALCNSDPLGTGAEPSWWAPETPPWVPWDRPVENNCKQSPCHSTGSSTETQGNRALSHGIYWVIPGAWFSSCLKKENTARTWAGTMRYNDVK